MKCCLVVSVDSASAVAIASATPPQPRAILDQDQRQHRRVRHVQRREHVAGRIDALDRGQERRREVGVGRVQDRARVLGADEDVPQRAQRHHDQHRQQRAVEQRAAPEARRSR